LTGVPERRADESGAGGGAVAGLSAGFSAGATAGFGASVSLSAGAVVGTQPLTLAAAGESLQSLSARVGVDWRAVANANDINNPRQLQGGAVLNLRAR
jgi:hypothetical protein